MFADPNAIISTPPPTSFPCPPGYMSYWYACYRFVDNPVTWSEADQLCRNEKAYLVSIHSEAENSAVFIYADGQLPKWLGLKRVGLQISKVLIYSVKYFEQNTLQQFYEDFVYLHVGICCALQTENEEFVWVDGWPDVYTKWGAIEPSNDECVVMTAANTWDAVPCNGTHGYICKISNGTLIRNHAKQLSYIM